MRKCWFLVVALGCALPVSGCGVGVGDTSEATESTERQAAVDHVSDLQSPSSSTEKIKCRLRCGGTVYADGTVSCCYYNVWACSGGSRVGSCYLYPASKYKGYCGSDIYCK